MSARAHARAGVIAACFACAAAAPAHGDSALVFGLDGSRWSGGGGSGSNTSVDWLHSSDGGHQLDLGLSHSALPGAGWTLARVGTSVQLARGHHLWASVDAGPGEQNGADFSYRKATAGVLLQLAPKIVLGGSDQYIDVTPSRGQLAAVSVQLLLSARLHARVEHARGISGNLHTRSNALRIDHYGRLHLLAGAAFGTTDPALVDAAGGAGGDLRETYCGVSFALGRQDLTLSFDTVSVAAVRRSSVSLSVRVPLGRRSSRR